MKKNKEKQNKRIRKGDTVIAISGNDRGMRGTVLSRTEDRVIVQGLNLRKKHMRKSEQYPQGGIAEIERPFHISNVQLSVDEGIAVKVRVRKDSSGNREMYYKKGDKEEILRTVKKS